MRRLDTWSSHGRSGRHRKAFVPYTWNQIFVGGHWVCLDAFLGADAARIAMAVGPGEAVTMIGMVQSLKTLKVVSVKAE